MMGDMTDDLVTFLHARLNEDEQTAQRGFSGQADPENGWGAHRPEGQRHTTITPHVGIIHEAVQADHVIRWNPARVLAEVEAKRQMIRLHACTEGHECSTLDRNGEVDHCAWVMDSEACTTLRLLALPYAGHPDYRPEWRP